MAMTACGVVRREIPAPNLTPQDELNPQAYYVAPWP